MSVLIPILGLLAHGLAAPSFDLCEPAGRPFEGVVTVGVALPPGCLTGEGGLRVRRGTRSVAAWGKTLCRHGDGSARWAAVTFRARLRGGERARHHVSVAAEASRFRERVKVTELDDGVRLDTGAIRGDVVEAPSLILRDVGRPGAAPQVRHVRLTHSGMAPRLRLVRRSPLEVIVEIEAFLHAPDGVGANVTRYVTARAGEPHLDIDVRVAHTGRGRAARLDLELEGAERRRRSVRPDEPSDFAADGTISMTTAAGAVHLAVRDAGPLWPARGEVTANGLRVVLVGSDEYRWDGVVGGRALRLALTGARRRRRPPRPFRDPLVMPRPQDPDLAPLAPARPVSVPLRRRLAARIERELMPDRLRENGLDWPGAENIGDWRWSRTDAGNLEYDTVWGLVAWSAVTGEPAPLERAVRAARHLVRRDRDATSRLPLRHGRHHRLGGMEIGHMWFDGLLAVARRTADRELLAAAEEIRTAWLRRGARPAVRNTRSAGWGLAASVALAEHFGGAADREVVRAFLARVVGAQRGDLPLFERPPESDLHHVPTWVAAGILGDAVTRAARCLGEARDGRLDRFLDRLIEEAWYEEESHLFAHLLCEPDGTVAARGGVCTGEERLFFAVGCLRAGGKNRALARTVTHGVEGDLRMDTKTFRGMEISQLLWCYPRLFGFER